jgi:hypothetical protein
MTIADELAIIRLQALAARARRDAQAQRDAIEGAIATSDSKAEHALAQAYRQGRADALATVARWVDVELVEIGRAERALVTVPR